tara:strand:+ start:2457 stop:2846 length:390 start_codon:yes stop_codon:yes gene_type:complete
MNAKNQRHIKHLSALAAPMTAGNQTSCEGEISYGKQVRLMRPMKGILLISAAMASILAIPATANASCYGTGMFRTCDGRGGYGATYSPRGSSGSTTYYNRRGGYSRRQDYTTYGSGSGRTRQTTTYYGF